MILKFLVKVIENYTGFYTCFKINCDMPLRRRDRDIQIPKFIQVLGWVPLGWVGWDWLG